MHEHRNAVADMPRVTLEERERFQQHRAAVVWFTGLSGSGKTTLARGLERQLFESGCRTVLLDGDQLRRGLCSDLGFGPAERSENIRRAGHLAHLLYEQGNLVLCAFVSPFCRDRDQVRALVGSARFVEVFVSCSLEECRRRDTKGLYSLARSGVIPNLTGVGQPYEAPTAPALIADTRTRSREDLIASLMSLLQEWGIIGDRAMQLMAAGQGSGGGMRPIPEDFGRDGG